MSKTGLTSAHVAAGVLFAGLSGAMSVGASEPSEPTAPPDDCEVSPCYWHFGDADTKIEVTGLDRLKGLASAGVTFVPTWNGRNPCVFTETVPWVVSDSNPDPENGCQDRSYRGEFQFDEEAECVRERTSWGVVKWGESSAKAMGTYRLWALARPQQISINFNKIANNVVGAGPGSDTIRGGSARSGISNDNDFLAVTVPFTVETTTLPVQLKIRATFLSTLGNQSARLCYDQPTDSDAGQWHSESRLWGGCGVYDSNGVVVEKLDDFAGNGFGSKAIVLDESTPSVGILTTEAVDLPPGEYEVRYWVHSYSSLGGGALDCPFQESSTDAHIFQTWLELVSNELLTGDINSDGRVDISDFSEFLVQFGLGVCDSDETKGLYTADLNDDGCVNNADFSLFLVEFGAAMECSTRRRF
jgi:hypothetical protein